MTRKKSIQRRKPRRQEQALTAVEVLKRLKASGADIDEIKKNARDAKKWPTKRLRKIPAYVRAIADKAWSDRRLKELWARMDDPQQAGHLCLELLDTVAKNDYDDAGPTALFQIIEKAADKLLTFANSDTHYASRAAAVLLAYAPKIFTSRACAALRHAKPEHPHKAAEALLHALVDSLLAFKQTVKQHPKQFEQWARSMLFFPSLRALTDNYRDDFDDIKNMIALSADYGFKQKGAFHLESPAVLSVAECLLWIRWIQRSEILSGEISKLEQVIRKTAFPMLTKDPKTIAIWWEKGVKPLLESELNGERLNRTQVLSPLEKRFDFAEYRKNRRRVKSESDFRQEILKDCRQALETLAPKAD